ncbi:MAG: glycerol-3-phosphate dehydrogenase [Frankiaceae bacterium]|jgi:glycerol-3-phosphate dehydrogenase|nr:glycerol-3-phosphate dehydrogenase [Frankiaceae bacterium]
MRGTPTLNLAARAAAWERLDGGYVDVLVVGAGVTGAGVALDAVTRGLSVAVVDGRDIGSGTSSRSSKLFHGGLRYLEQLDLQLVREALRERDLMVTRLAPHLVRPVSFLYPLQHYGWERLYVGAGLALYDLLGGSRALPRHRHLSRTRARALAPALKRTALVGGIRYYDAQTDDARHTLMLARTAAAYGAVVRTSTEVVGFLREGGRVVGAELRDTETGAQSVVRTGVVVNATGVWTDDVQRMADSRGEFKVRASKGIHLVVPRDRISSETGLILRTEKSVLFVIPWNDHWILGTTDEDWVYDKAHPAASSVDIDYVLDHVNAVLAVPLTRADISGVYAGLRPLLSGEHEETSQLSREHAISRSPRGMVSVAGGKYTTYRVMARDAVDAAVAELGRPVPPCVTHEIPLVGADGYHALANQVPTLAEDLALPSWRIDHLLGRYGALIDEVLAPVADDPSLLEPVPGAGEYLMAEIRYAASHEGALHLDDVLTRRTRISIGTTHRGVESMKAVAALLAGVLGWDDEQTVREIAAYDARVAAERASQEATDDENADARRLVAPDTRRTIIRSRP